MHTAFRPCQYLAWTRITGFELIPARRLKSGWYRRQHGWSERYGNPAYRTHCPEERVSRYRRAARFFVDMRDPLIETAADQQ